MQDYLEKVKAEGISIMDMLYDQEYLTAIHEKTIKKQGYEEGIKQGSRAQTIKIYNKGLISLNDAADLLSISTEEFEKLLDQ